MQLRCLGRTIVDIKLGCFRANCTLEGVCISRRSYRGMIYSYCGCPNNIVGNVVKLHIMIILALNMIYIYIEFGVIYIYGQRDDKLVLM